MKHYLSILLATIATAAYAQAPTTQPPPVQPPSLAELRDAMRVCNQHQVWPATTPLEPKPKFSDFESEWAHCVDIRTALLDQLAADAKEEVRAATKALADRLKK
jgi:hypothetical protein